MDIENYGESFVDMIKYILINVEPEVWQTMASPILYYILNYPSVLMMFLTLQLSWLTLWTGHTTRICQLALWLCHGWAASWLKYRSFYLVAFYHCYTNICTNICGKIFIFSVYVSVCWQHFISRGSWSSGILPLQVGGIFFNHSHFCVRCPLLPWFRAVSTFVLFLEWIVCLARLFGLSVLVYFQSHAFFVQGNSRFFLFTLSSGICANLVITCYSIFLIWDLNIHFEKFAFTIYY